MGKVSQITNVWVWASTNGGFTTCKSVTIAGHKAVQITFNGPNLETALLHDAGFVT